MPTKWTFDLVLIMGLLIPPALGLLRMTLRRWPHTSTGIATTAGRAGQILLGK